MILKEHPKARAMSQGNFSSISALEKHDDFHMRDGNRSDPSCVFTIFGGTGDLAKRLLVPALYHLSIAQLLPPHFRVV